MAKTAITKPSAGNRKPATGEFGTAQKAGTGGFKVGKAASTGEFPTQSDARFQAVMTAAKNSGLLGEKDDRISGRVNHALIEQAKRRTGIQTDTDLIEFALANIALEDNFADAFKKSRGKVDPDLKLGF